MDRSTNSSEQENEVAKPASGFTADDAARQDAEAAGLAGAADDVARTADAVEIVAVGADTDHAGEADAAGENGRTARRTIGREGTRTGGRTVSSTSRSNRTQQARPTRRTTYQPTRRTSGSARHATSGGASQNPRGRLIAIAVVLAALLVAAIAAAAYLLGQSGDVPGASSASSPSASSASASGSSASPSSDAKEPTVEPDVKALNKLLGKKTASKLVKRAETDGDAAWIASHVDSYASDGDEVQAKILKLAAEEPKALPYVRQFAESYPEKRADMSRAAIVPESEFKGTEFETKTPHLFQWDMRWGQTVYSSTTFGLTGCGPTSMAMVYQSITGKSDLSPADMAQIAEDGGYMSQFDGTGSGFFYFIAAQNDFSCTDLPISGENIVAALQAGQIVIANLAEGYFTEGGHFFVLAGLTDDGKVIVNDPYSYERSTKAWDADFIANESMALFAFSSDPYPHGWDSW